MVGVRPIAFLIHDDNGRRSIIIKDIVDAGYEVMIFDDTPAAIDQQEKLPVIKS